MRNAPEIAWRAYRNLAQVEAKLDSGNAAISDLEQALPFPVDLGSLLKTNMNPESAAISHYEQALGFIESIRANLSEEKTKINFMQNKLIVYDEFIDLLQKMHHKYPHKEYDKKAFEIFERKQGRTFLEIMGDSGARNFAGIPQTIIDKETELINTEMKVQTQLAALQTKPGNHQLIGKLHSRLQEVQIQKTDFRTLLKEDHPDYYALRYPQPVPLKTLQKSVLSQGEAILAYAVLKEKTCLWLVSQDHFSLHILPIGKQEMAKHVNGYRKQTLAPLISIDKNEPSARIRQVIQKSLPLSKSEAMNLFTRLMPAQVQEVLANAQILYIIPTESLYNLPFEGLLYRDENGNDRYLIQDLSVSYLSSASLLKVLRDAQTRKRQIERKTLIAFAHPVYQRSPSIIDKGETRSVRAFRARNYTDTLNGISELPDTEKEVRKIQHALNAPESALHLRDKASESYLYSLHKSRTLEEYQYVVFSCHGVIPDAEESSMVNQPALILSLPDPDDPVNQDGFLTFAEVFGIRLNADLVSLSACNTGRQNLTGNVQQGEGAASLTRAFMFAGTPAVSVNLWAVESASAGTLNAGFFDNLSGGENRAKALQKIKCRMIKGDAGQDYTHPFFWAPLIVFGIK